MFRSATFKLTMYYLIIIAVISIGFSFAVYKIGTSDLEYSLQSQTERISTNFPVFSGSPYLRMGDELQEGRRHLIGQLVLFNTLILAVAGFASYALARRTLRPIEEAHDRQKRFTADVSHELRTPLTALKMESEVALMDDNASKSELQAVLRSNVEETEKLTNLVTNLLRLGQLDDAEKSKLLYSVQVTDVVQAAVSQLEPIAQQRNIQLTVKTDPDVTVQGDRDTLVQLLIILLDNAIKYSPRSSAVTITIQTQQNVAKISISDSGVGIAKKDLEHVFERFYRADAARTNSDPANGFGLGLSIAKLIADTNNATISLTSSVGKGTTASVLIPISPTTLAADQPKA